MAGAGGKREGAGRTKGVGNKVTTETREAFKKLVEDNTPAFQGWLDKIAKTNPAKAFELITNLAEYVLPKLSRTEVTGDLKVKADVNVTGYSDEELKTISDIRKAKELKELKEKN